MGRPKGQEYIRFLFAHGFSLSSWPLSIPDIPGELPLKQALIKLLVCQLGFTYGVW
jgi:hypothetical protein